MLHHDHLVKSQRFLFRTATPGAFVAGHKADVVRTLQSSAASPGVAIYGWHRPDGRPIQPLFVADGGFPSFNHGVRLVHHRLLVDGKPRDLSEVLADPTIAPLLTGEVATTMAG